MTDKTIENVKEFWEKSPLFTGESDFEPGSPEFFDHHRQVSIDDVFAGDLNAELFPKDTSHGDVLDLGCGPGFWSMELLQRGAKSVTAADLTENGLALTRKRAEVYGFDIITSQQNAEAMTFEDKRFDHVNCMGVIHHTPDTEACVREIARVLKPGGTASLSVYYLNVFLRAWPVLKYAGRLLHWIGSGLKGRGRENIFALDDVAEIVRHYDGSDNPIGKVYSRKQFREMLAPYFEIEEEFLHFFPARAFPFRIPHALHAFLDDHAGFLIAVQVRKKRGT